MSTALTTAQPALPIALMDPGTFDQMQRVGKMLALSPLFPEHLRRGNPETAIANGVLVINMAMRLREDPLTVAQSIYFVGGKPGWSASYMIAKANQHGVFRDPIDWEIKGSKDSLSVTAFAVLASTGKRVAVTCDMAMAKAEGWTKNAKYQSMPEQMLRYRSATFLIRLYCPEVMVGVPAAIEHELAMKDVTPDYEPATVVETEADPAPHIEHREEQKAKFERKAEPETVEAAPVKEGDPKQADAFEGRPSRRDMPKAADQRDHNATYAKVTGDMLDEAPIDYIAETYGERIAEMRAEAPQLFESLMAEFEAYVPGASAQFKA